MGIGLAFDGAVAYAGVRQRGVKLQVDLVVPHDIINKCAFGVLERYSGAKVAYDVAVDHTAGPSQF